MHRIYLDWNATAPLHPEVREAIVSALDTVPGNASSVHQEGQAARTHVERARRAIARALGAPPQAVVLTGGATESNNIVLRDFARRFPTQRIWVSPLEHPSVVEVARDLERAGTDVRWLVVDRFGQFEFPAEISSGDLLSAMWANNEIGNVTNIALLAQQARDAGALLHVDATQAIGRVPVRFDVGVDIMTLSFHKMGGPKGVGAVVLREGRKVEAILAGGHQERGRRPGTENVPAIVGAEAAMQVLMRDGATWFDALRQKRSLVERALRGIAGLRVRGGAELGLATLPNTINFAIDGVDGEDLLLALDLDGLALSSGSACTAGSLEASHVLIAMGFAPADAKRSVRLSFGPSTSDSDLEEAGRRIVASVDRLRRI